MREHAVEEAAKLLASDRRRRIWKKIVGILACVVVFCTTYALILPVITLEKIPSCGKTEHTHTEACYTPVSHAAETVPICTPESLGLHTHTADCYNAAGELVCGYADFFVHTHDASCYDADGVLWCPLPEIEAHTHTDSCWAVPETAAHTHTDECYASEQGELICAIPEGEGAHTHSEACYTAEQVMTCSVPESEGHRHDETCYAQNRVLICGLSEEPAPAGETAEPELVCGREEIILHTHDASCFDESGALICGQVQVLEHRHTAACFQTVEEPAETLELTCDMEEHVHTDDCYPRRQESLSNAPYACGMEEHTHSDACYSESGELLCTMAEHTHTDACRLLFADSAMEELGMTAVLSANGASAEAAAADGAPAAEPLKLPVSNVKGTGTTYDPDTDSYGTNLTIEYRFENAGAVQPGVDYVFNYGSDIIVPQDQLGEHTLYDGSKAAGTYTFIQNADGTYSVQVKFSQDYLQGATGEVTGDVSFWGKLTKKTDESGGITIHLGTDTLDVTIPPEQITHPSDETENYDISVSKDGSFVETDGNQLIYTVYVRSRKGTPDPIAFQDVLTSTGSLELGAPTVTVEQGTYKYYSQHNQQDVGDWKKVTPQDVSYSSGNISMNLPGLAPGVEPDEDGRNSYILGNCYKITYVYTLPENIAELRTSCKNTVTVTATDKTNGQTVTGKDEKTLRIDKRYTLGKSGSYDSSSGRIKWTITVNDNQVDIAGAQLTDNMLAQLAQGTEINIEPDEGYTYVTKNGSITGIQFNPVNDDRTNTNKYTITYYTEAPAVGWDSQTVTNRAVFDPDPDTDGGESHSTGSTTVPGTGSVDKTHGAMVTSPDGTAVIPWTVTVDVPAGGLPAGTTIEDSISGNGHWMTHDQVAALLTGMQWADGSKVDVKAENIELKNSWWAYKPYAEIMSSTNGEDQALIAFKITLPENLTPPDGKAQKLVFTYYTTVDLNRAAAGTTNYTNSVNVGGKTDYDTCPYHKGGVVKTDGNGQTGTTQITTTGDTLTWIVKVDVAGNSPDWLKLEDILPQGVTLDDISVSGDASIDVTVGTDGKITGSSNNGTSVSGTYDQNTSKIELNMTGVGSNAHYEFKFSCKADQALLDGTPHPLTNSVTVTTNGGTLGSDTQTQEWTHKVEETVTKIMTKTAGWEPDAHILRYSIVVNPERKDLLADADDLTLTDKLEYNSLIHYGQSNNKTADVKVTLFPESVKLYYAVPGGDGGWIRSSEVLGWGWTYTGDEKPGGWSDYWDQRQNTITVTGVPDGATLIFEYAYQVSTTLPMDEEVSLTINNTARLEGVQNSETTNGSTEVWKDSGSSGTVSTGRSYTFYKVEAGKYNRLLSGAVFSVYQYDPSTQQCADAPVTAYTTDQDGTFHIQWQESDSDCQYEKNILYMVKETQAPENYKLPDQAPGYYFYFSDENDTAHTLPEPLPDGAVDLSETGKTVYAENVRDATDIVVKKEWCDADGNVVPHNTDTFITVNVYQKKSTTASGEGGGSGPEDEVEEGMAKVRWTGYIYDSNVNFTEPKEVEYLKVPVGTKIKLTVTAKEDEWNKAIEDSIPRLKVNDDQEIIMNRVEGTSDFSCTVIVNGETTLCTYCRNGSAGMAYLFAAGLHSWTFEYPDPTPDEPESGAEPVPEAPFETLTLNKANDWRAELLDLPLSGTDADGNTVYYTYYVEEVEVPNYTPTYTNNGGITSGTITITNTLEKNPGHQLPATGGSGTRPYTIGGLLLTGAGAILLYSKRKRGRGAGKVF